ncbi:lipopolysaccharide assembly protein LapB [Rhodohalobacter sp. SW132]|uniref:tetratricopeptide repeat protein n=1 Tax=Rhodohalobacter sp. SW132 TaxID=2293433 RepID=UPI0013143FE9|nr:tetratricopeptide repeat protein [Rhodohalobacter sp. SW132]
MTFVSAGEEPVIIHNEAPVAAADIHSGSFEEKLETAIEHFYQTRWEQAGEQFDELKKQHPKDPRPYFFESMMPFWEYFFVQQRGELADLFLERSENAVDLSKQRLEEQPNDTTMVLLLSGLHGYRSLVAAGEKKYRVAIQSGITGFNYTRQLLSIDSERPDAQIGRGMYYYMVGTVPREVRWLTNAAGLRGDTEMGFQELKKAAESDNIIRYDAQMILMYLHEKEEEYDKALQYAQKLTDRFEENVIFHYKRGELLEKTGERSKAIESYNAVITRDNPYLGEITELSRKRVEDLQTLGMKN